MKVRLTNDDFIKKSKKIHGEKYDYSLVNYKTNKIKVKIICPIHGIFEQRPNAHLKGCICHEFNGNKKINTEKFIELSNDIHNFKYDYSFVIYKTDKIKVKIVCPIHGVFEQSPNVHYNHGCNSCSNDDKKFTTSEFILKSKKIHGDKFDYSLVEYKNIKTKVKIVCPKHGIFKQSPLSNLKGNGCYKCSESKGENFIDNFLKLHEINFYRQMVFEDCKNIKKLPFDFYLPDYNICIEFDGEQHYKPIHYWGGKKTFDLLLKRDEIKTNFCIKNKIKLIRIKYNQNISDKLYKELNI